MATGLVSEREVRKYEREAREMGKASFYLAWLMDEDRYAVMGYEYVYVRLYTHMTPHP